MKLGDFSSLARFYKHRPGYSLHLLAALMRYIGLNSAAQCTVADIGAGTGKLTKILLDLGFHVIAVEPNRAMREEGKKYAKGKKVHWVNGSAEHTTLDDQSVDWVIMASSFHWTDEKQSLPEFHRILKPNGYFTALWNPRDIGASEFHTKIEDLIYSIAPNIKRVSSGSKTHTKAWEKVITSTGHFKDVILMETDHTEVMSQQRYLGAWKSVNDIQVQAGREKWEKILKSIRFAIRNEKSIIVPYKNRAWTAQRV